MAYRQCLGITLKKSEDLLAEVMRRLPEGGAKAKTIVNTIVETARAEDSNIGWRFPRGMDAEDYFELLVHRGGGLQIGHPGGSGLHSCPIPSFREFLIGLTETGRNTAPRA